MAHVNLLSRQFKEIQKLLDKFYWLLTGTDSNFAFALMSPNLWQFCAMDEHFETFKTAIMFEYGFVDVTLLKLVKIRSGLLEGIVMVAQLPEPWRRAIMAGDQRIGLKYNTFKMQFIYIWDTWLIDDISTNEDFWKREYQEGMQNRLN